MMLPDARALARRLNAAHSGSDFYGVLRNNSGYSMLVVTEVSVPTVIRWFEAEGMTVRKFDKQLDKALTWRVWFQENGTEKRSE